MVRQIGKEGDMESKKMTLSKADLKSLGITLGLAVVSVIITKLIEVVPGIDFGTNSEVFVAVILGLLKTGQKLIAGK